MTHEAENQKPLAMALLEAGLQELRHQLVTGDTRKIAQKVHCSERTVIRYIKDLLIANFNTGKKILDAGRDIVIKREHSLSPV